MDCFHRIAERLQPRQERLWIVAVCLFRRTQVADLHAVVPQPAAVGVAFGNLPLHFVVGHQSTAIEIDQEHAPRLQAALRLNQLWIDRQHSDFARHDHSIIVRHVVPAGTQAVTVQDSANVMTIREGDRCGAIPRFHQATVIFIESPFVFRHRLVFLPRFRDHHHDRFLERSAGHQEKLQDVVERARVRAVCFDNREELGQIFAKQLAVDDTFARPHPVDVATQRVDLTVVAHEPIWLRSIPTRKRVGREAGVDHCKVRS